MSRVRLLVVCLVLCVTGVAVHVGSAVAVRTSRSGHGVSHHKGPARASHASRKRSGSRRSASGRRRRHLPASQKGASRRQRGVRRRALPAKVGVFPALGGPLVVSGSPTEGEQLEAARAAVLTNPETLNLRAISETAYEGLNAEGAGKVDVEAFPTVINEPDGGPPQLPEGERVTGFSSPYTAQVDLGGQVGTEQGVVESTIPVALEGSSGSWEPVDLGLREVGGVLEPSNPLVAVRVAKHLSEGVQLPAIGLSVTPIDSQGSSLSGSEGVISGASAFFANSMTDSDTIIKPSAFGFSIDTALRSAKSPERISFRIGLPDGASLAKAGEDLGGLVVVKEGVTIAGIPAPIARDASGQIVPVTVGLTGNVLTLTVARQTGKDFYPIELDPEFNSGSDTTVTKKNWLFTKNGWFSDGAGEKNELGIGYYGSYDEGEYGALNYQTHGHSKIYEVNASTSFEPSACCNIEGKLYSQNTSISDTLEIHSSSGGNEGGVAVVSEPTFEWPIKTRLCAKAECAAVNGSENNTVTLQSTITRGSDPAEGEYSGAGDELKAATVSISQPAEIHSTVSFNTVSSEIDKTVNVLYGQGGWMNSHQGAFEYTGRDTGVGVDGINFERNLYGAYEIFNSKSLLETSACAGIQCAGEQKEALAYESPLGNDWEGTHNLSYYLKEGENHLRISPHDAIAKTGAGEHGEGEIVLKVDKTPPHNLTMSGLPTRGETYQLSEAVGHVILHATDGEGSVASSGVKSISLYVDGKEVGAAHGSCPAGPCTANGEWTLNGAELGAGQHTFTVSATDNAGNTETKGFAVEVYHASPLAMGPGSVNPESGDFALEAADVQLSGGMGDLSVTRHYDSRNLKEGSEGPLGPQWSISLGSLASLEILPDGSAMIVGPDGLVHFTKNSEERFVAPTGDSNLVLESKSGEPYKEYLLKNRANGTTTRFTRPVGANAWMPTISEGPVATDTVTDTYKTAEVEEKTIVEPALELAPHPSATCEAKKLERGCRALEFDYASITTATGQAESEWGEYKGRLTRITATAWNRAKGEMTAVAVAEYAYDRQGRLRAEWDPRIIPALKTVYCYDTEGHITAITPPGQETIAFIYGTIPSDTNTGRLLKVTRAPASALPLWSGEPVKNTEAPVITGLPEVGVRLAASEGHWSGSPVVYGYQWEHCNNSGGECSSIPGATNANYTPTPSEANSSLTVLVTATNGGGTVTASRTVQVEANQTVQGTPFGITTGSDGNLWFTNFGTNKIGKITPSGATTEYALPRGSLPMGMALGPDGNVWFTDFSSDKIGKVTTSGVITEYALPAGSKPSGIVAGPDGNLWFSDLDTGEVGKITTSGVITEYALPAGSKPSAIAKGSDGNLWVADRGVEKIYKVTTSGVITEYALPAGSQPEGIASGPEGDLWFTEFHSNKIGKITTSGSITEYALPNESWPSGISSGPDGNIWFTDYKSGKIGKITASGTITEYALPSMNAPAGITSGPDGNLWFADEGDSEVGKITLSGAITEYWLPNVEGEYRSPEPGSTIEYDVPVSGVGAPYEMGAKEIETWNEKLGPVEATAIFPSDEPQGWPASKYTRATIDYMDSRARTVNTATPGGGISTTQYNEYNEPEETLSAANRQTALAEGGNTAMKAKGLTSYTIYVEEGTRIWESFGPIHEAKVVKGTEKLPSGSEVMAHNRVVYYYDEGAPTGETYDLVTKTVDFGESSTTGEHFDVRTSTTSYSGQNNLGWKLREPTSTVTDPEGLKITHTTIYNEATGNIVETRGPASSGPGEAHDSISVYYTAEPNTTYPACGGHIEWSGLPCETLPGKQPKTSGLPPLPEKTITYNIWNEPETVTEAFGSTTRTRKTTFDEAGRALTSEINSSVDTPVSAITDHYSETTGALVKESEIVEGKEKGIVSVYNTLGQLTSYTDADGNTTTYEYEGEGSYTGEKEKDGRLRHISDGKGNQTYSYNETTGLMTKLVDSAAGTFTAAYNLAGRMTSETYPNNMTATYTYNSVGDTTGLEYKKNADCAKTCPEVWFGDTIVPSVHGEELKQTSTLSEEPKYTYDAAGRLTEVQEIPAGKGCVTRLYAYNVESDRTSLTSREPTSEGKCAPEGGTTENHAYDEAGRLIDTGVTYDTFGNITKMPATDAGGAEISSSFYTDSQLASQTQSGETSTYYMDPAGRIRETISSGKTASVTTDHYDGSGSAISWISEPEEKWTRNIPGIDGTLSATQTNSGTMTLLLHDLQGNVVATAALSETATKVLTTYNSTEFGVPQSGTQPPKYAWLGATGVTSESTTGAIVQDGITYVPQTGRPLQTQSLTVPIPQNAAKAYTDTLEPWVAEGDAAAAAQQVVNAEQARAAAEQANQPPGVLPDGNPGWCGGEFGECEAEWEPAESDGMARIASSRGDPNNCILKTSWGHYVNNRLGVWAHVSCITGRLSGSIAVEVCLMSVDKSGKLVKFECGLPEDRDILSMGRNEGIYEGGYRHTWGCEEEATYAAWSGALESGPDKESLWSTGAFDGHYEMCPTAVEDPTGGPAVEW